MFFYLFFQVSKNSIAALSGSLKMGRVDSLLIFDSAPFEGIKSCISFASLVYKLRGLAVTVFLKT